MQEINKNIDHLFTKAKNAEVTYSMDKVQAGILAASATGVIATISSIIKTKFLSIMIVSGIVITASALIFSGGNPEVKEASIPVVQTEEPQELNIEDNSVETIVEPEEVLTTEIEDIVELSNTEIDQIETPPVDQTMLFSDAFAPQDRKPVGLFHSIVVEINCDVELLLGDSYETEVLQEELEDVISYKIKDGVLTVGIVEGKEKEYEKVSRKQIVEVELTMPSIKSIEVLGAAVVHSDDNLKSDDLNLSIMGSGDIALSRVVPTSYTVNLSGSGDIYLKSSGKVKSGDINITGSGDVWLGKLETEKVAVNIYGSGDVDVHASKELAVTIGGSGDVCYSGDPVKEVKISGSGEVGTCSCDD